VEWLWRFVLTAAVQTQKLLCCAVLWRQCPELRFGPVLFFTPSVICYDPCLVPVHMVTLTCKGRPAPPRRCITAAYS
jgi:hypothetical protein